MSKVDAIWSNLDCLSRINYLITEITSEHNKFKLTNICCILIVLSFEYVKKLDRTQVTSNMAYNTAVVIVTEIYNTNSNIISIDEFIKKFMSIIVRLEEEKIPKNTYNNENEIEGSSFLN